VVSGRQWQWYEQLIPQWVPCQHSGKGHLSTRVEKSMEYHQSLDNVGGVDAVWRSHRNVDVIRGHEGAVKRRPSPQRSRRQTCHVVGTI